MSANVNARIGRNNNVGKQNSRMITDNSKIDINKLKPKRVHAEKERLYEDALKLKIQSNSYKSENVKLKT